MHSRFFLGHLRINSTHVWASILSSHRGISWLSQALKVNSKNAKVWGPGGGLQLEMGAPLGRSLALVGGDELKGVNGNTMEYMYLSNHVIHKSHYLYKPLGRIHTCDLSIFIMSND